jgi:hypothetical protein
MSRWLPRILRRIRALAAVDAFRLTEKAQQEAELLALSPADVWDVVAGLSATDSAGRVVSEENGEWLYVFKPTVGGEVVYVKLAVRGNCVVVSFHEDKGAGHEEDE